MLCAFQGLVHAVRPRVNWSLLNGMFHEVNLIGKSSFWPETMSLEGLDQTEQEYNLDSQSQLNEDEQIARALWECLSIEYPPLQANQNGSWQGCGYGNGNFYQLLTSPYTTSCRLLIGLILVHGNIHAWLQLKGYQTLGQYVEEGMLSAGAYVARISDYVLVVQQQCSTHTLKSQDQFL
nr:protein DA1-like [Ipomoea batatas]